MKKRWKRLLIIMFGLCGFASIVFFILLLLGDNISFFYSPTQAIIAGPMHKEIKLGGTVRDVIKHKDHVEFLVTDDKNAIKVIYHGLSPALMQSGIDIVAYGDIQDNIFYAKQILIKHDERYKPSDQVDIENLSY